MLMLIPVQLDLVQKFKSVFFLGLTHFPQSKSLSINPDHQTHCRTVQSTALSIIISYRRNESSNLSRTTLIVCSKSRITFAMPALRTRSSTDPPCIDVLLHPSAIRTAPLLSESSLGPKSEPSTYVQDLLTVSWATCAFHAGSKR